MALPLSFRLLLAFAAVEVVGIAIGSAGLVVEFIYGADVGFVLLTAGGLTFGIGSGLWAKAYKAR